MARGFTKAHILAEIRRTAGENGVALGRARFAAETGIRESDWSGRYWARWSDALKEAGFQPRQLQGRYEDDAVLASLVPEVRRLGRMPTIAERRLKRQDDRSFPSSGVFEKFGSNQALAAKLVDYCNRHPEWSDVLAIVVPLAEPDLDKSGDPATPESGFVYLLRSGRNYKLGRSNAFGRRERELAIQLPERAQTIHVIRTDDPVGIEAYWHRRFADRRGNGEWFALTATDVAAFRRRKFM